MTPVRTHRENPSDPVLPDREEVVRKVLDGATPIAAQLITGHHRTVLRGTTVAAAADVLAASGLPMVPVCEPDGRLAGVLTDRAILSAIALDPGAPGRLVEELMNHDPAFVADYASAEWILVEMQDAHTWSLPVTDALHHLLGVVTLADLAPAVFPGLLAQTWNHILG